MTIVLDGSSGITAPTYGGNVASEYHVPVTAFKNRIINGNMAIDQRNAGASVTISTGAYTLDRWVTYASQVSKYSIQQNAGAVTPPVGFSNYLGATSLSAYSVLTSDYFVIQQNIEGFNTADLGFGTVNASAVTLSFWVRSSLTGTFGGALQNSASTRSYPFSYSIPVANTWTNISITIAGDTTGTWVGATNGIGLQVRWGIGVGATSSGTAGSWSGGNYYSATGATSVVGTSGATFYITGVQLEKGSTATSFDQRAYSQELAMCQRYYQQWGGNTQNERLATGYNQTNAQTRIDMPLVVTMRAVPTATVSAASDWTVESATGSFACTSFVLDQPSTKIASFTISVTTGVTSGQGVHIMANSTTNARLNLSAEL